MNHPLNLFAITRAAAAAKPPRGPTCVVCGHDGRGDDLCDCLVRCALCDDAVARYDDAAEREVAGFGLVHVCTDCACAVRRDRNLANGGRS